MDDNNDFITRVDERYGGTGRITNGWHVRLKHDGDVTRRFFADSKYGDSEKALVQARSYRDEIVSEFGRYSTADRRERMTVRNTSGKVGVRRVTRERKGNFYDSWVAFWTGDDKVRRVVSFSVSKFGEEEAEDLARFAREHLIWDRMILMREYKYNKEAT